MARTTKTQDRHPLRKFAQIAGVVLGLGVVVLLLAFTNRQTLALHLYAQFSETPTLLSQTEEGDGVRWFDDYYTIEELDAHTIAIGEPRYHQQNYNYLILGEDRAVLFDSGPGIRDIKPVIDSLTNLPVIVTQSHLHYDHVGNHDRFDSLAMIDLPNLRDRAVGGQLSLTDSEHLGYIEDIPAPILKVSEWWTPGNTIDLGGRMLTVIHAPGHTPDSMILFDRERGQLFTGDFLYPGTLFGFLPGSNMSSYLKTAERLSELNAECTALYAAHRFHPPGAPQLTCGHIADLERGLRNIRDQKSTAEGFYPASFEINEKLSILTDVPWLIDWNE